MHRLRGDNGGAPTHPSAGYHPGVVREVLKFTETGNRDYRRGLFPLLVLRSLRERHAEERA